MLPSFISNISISHNNNTYTYSVRSNNLFGYVSKSGVIGMLYIYNCTAFIEGMDPVLPTCNNGSLSRICQDLLKR